MLRAGRTDAAAIPRPRTREPSREWTISAGPHRATIVQVGGGLRDYRVDGAPLVDAYRRGGPAPGGAGQVLAPWPNRIRDGRYTFRGEKHQLALTEPDAHNAIHGLVR